MTNNQGIKVNESRTRDDPDIEISWQELKITMLKKAYEKDKKNFSREN